MKVEREPKCLGEWYTPVRVGREVLRDTRGALNAFCVQTTDPALRCYPWLDLVVQGTGERDLVVRRVRMRRRAGRREDLRAGGGLCREREYINGRDIKIRR